MTKNINKIFINEIGLQQQLQQHPLDPADRLNLSSDELRAFEIIDKYGLANPKNTEIFKKDNPHLAELQTIFKNEGMTDKKLQENISKFIEQNVCAFDKQYQKYGTTNSYGKTDIIKVLASEGFDAKAFNEIRTYDIIDSSPKSPLPSGTNVPNKNQTGKS